MEYAVADRIQLGEVDNTENEPDQATRVPCYGVFRNRHNKNNDSMFKKILFAQAQILLFIALLYLVSHPRKQAYGIICENVSVTD